MAADIALKIGGIKGLPIGRWTGPALTGRADPGAGLRPYGARPRSSKATGSRRRTGPIAFLLRT
ncbi:hypothetical protein ROS1_59490 [Roseibium sp. ROS1]